MPGRSHWCQITPTDVRAIPLMPGHSHWCKGTPTDARALPLMPVLSHWYQCAPTDTRALPLMPVLSHWYQCAPTDTRALQLIPGRSNWYQGAPTDTSALQLMRDRFEVDLNQCSFVKNIFVKKRSVECVLLIKNLIIASAHYYHTSKKFMRTVAHSRYLDFLFRAAMDRKSSNRSFIWRARGSTSIPYIVVDWPVSYSQPSRQKDITQPDSYCFTFLVRL